MPIVVKREICEKCPNFKTSWSGHNIPEGFFGCVGNYRIVYTQFSAGPQYSYQNLRDGEPVPEWCQYTAEHAVIQKEATK